MVTAAKKSLYERLGGYEAICAAVDDLMPRLFKDPQIGSFWKGKSQSSKRMGRQLLVDFLSEATGGCAYYTGRDMRTVHTGLHITESDWQVFMSHAAATLNKLGVPKGEQADVVAAFNGLKKDIVGL